MENGRTEWTITNLPEINLLQNGGNGAVERVTVCYLPVERTA